MKSKLNRTLIYITALIIVSSIIVTTCLYYRYAAKSYREQVGKKLSVIADLKVHEIEQWRKERLADAEIFHDNPSFAMQVNRYFKNPNEQDALKQIKSWMNIVYQSKSFNGIFLLNALYVKKLIIPQGLERDTSYVSPKTSKILRKGEIAFEDFYRNETNNKIFLKIIVPILDNQNNSIVIGYIAMRINPEDYLYPLINTWPTLSKTAEILILRREGNDIVFLTGKKIKKMQL